MGRAMVYVNGRGRVLEAFAFYADVFGGSPQTVITAADLRRLSGEEDAAPGVAEAAVVHVELKLRGTGTVLVGTDCPTAMGYPSSLGEAPTINIEADSLEQTRHLFELLSGDATDVPVLREPFWGAMWGSCLDRYGVRWTFTSWVQSQQRPDTL
jgi:PhnB protein